MKYTTLAPRVFSLLLLAAPQNILSGLTFASAAPATDGKGLCHVASQRSQNSGEGGHNPPGIPPVEVDVVVVGGGFSGMSAAHDLQNTGLKTVVLEARDRLGGRSRTQKLESGPGIIELGATWINNKTQPAVFALTQEFGLETIEQYTNGYEVFQSVDGSVSVLSEDAEVTEEEAEQALAIVEIESQLMTAMNEAVEAIDIRTFDEFPIEQDVTLEEWVAQKGLWDHPFVQGLCSQLSAVIVGREPHEIGAHFFFDYVKSGGGFESLRTEGRDGAQSLMIKTGTTSIVNNIADSMPPGSVLTNSPVTSITQEAGNVIVTTKGGKQFKAKKAILAILPHTYENIEFSPTLPSDKQGLVSESMPGNYAKVVFSYTEAWWRDAGLVGKFPSHAGPVRFSWEISVPSLSQYSLTLFVAGDNATDWQALPEPEKIEVVKEQLATLVGDELADRARDTLEINYMEWTKQDFIGAGPTSALGPGMLRKYGDTLRAPFEGLHFAGTETAFEWKGYLEGAVTAGKRAAKEVVEALGVGTN